MWNENCKKWITFGMLAIAVIIFLKYILPVCWPVLLAFLFVSCTYDRMIYIEGKYHIPRVVTVGLLCIISVGMVGVTVYFLLRQMMNWCMEGMNVGGGIQEILKSMLHQGCSCMEEWMNLSGQKLESSMIECIENGIIDARNTMLPKVVNGSMVFGRCLFDIFARLAVTMVMIFLLIREYGSFKVHLYRLPFASPVMRIRNRLLEMGKVYLKAQGIIMGFIILLVSIGIYVIGNQHFIFVGILTGILDVFPFIGTGIILIPYSLWMFLQKKIWQGIVLLFLYGACALVRNLLEPKLIGKGMKVSPVMILLSVFIGIKVYGVAGVVLGPFTFILLWEIYKEIDCKH